MRKIVSTILCVASLAGCAEYHPRPLTTQSTLPSRVSDVTIDARQMPLPELATHRFDPADGLDITEVAMLAVVNNPDLKTARAAAGIAHAQAFAAGLLPDPQVGLAVDVPAGGMPAPVAAYSLGVGYDVIALLMRGPLRDAARGEADRTDLNLLWHEWQVVSQARQLFVRLHEDGQLMAVLNEYRAMFADRYRRTQTALDRG